MKKIVSVLIFTFFAHLLFSQVDKVQGRLSSRDTAELKILKVYPDSFPNISVVFKAETKKGEPLWALTREKMQVEENSHLCQVVSLEPISKNKAITLGIVIDHSGSMEFDENEMFDKNGNLLFELDANLQPILPKWYKGPIEVAKTAVKSFVQSFNIKKDFISIIGFSTKIDKVLTPTQDPNKVNAIVDAMHADSSTALYDAIFVGLEQIKASSGVKVLIVLTDGQDNASSHTLKEVIIKANSEEIPLYMIGLGMVNKDTLGMLAKSTQGRFFYAKSAASLDIIYQLISKQVQAFYNLVYSSDNFSLADTSRQLEISFNADSLYLNTISSSYELPKEAVAFIQQKEKEKERSYMLYTGLALATAIGAGTIVFRIRTRSRPRIKNLYPNPSKGSLTIEGNVQGQLNIRDMNGTIVKTIETSGTEIQLDLSELPDNIYVATIETNGKLSNAVKFILRK